MKQYFKYWVLETILVMCAMYPVYIFYPVVIALAPLLSPVSVLLFVFERNRHHPISIKLRIGAYLAYALCVLLISLTVFANCIASC